MMGMTKWSMYRDVQTMGMLHNTLDDQTGDEKLSTPSLGLHLFFIDTSIAHYDQLRQLRQSALINKMGNSTCLGRKMRECFVPRMSCLGMSDGT